YIIEFKCNQSAEAGIRQIHDQGYVEKYRQSGKEIILMGINFSTEKRNLEGWQVEADTRHPKVDSLSERSRT
ncbi:MAG: PD-(D/E)XK nuclease domain-containing protein, partial [Chloroflexota bacterium]|nr:PD-(D/E)XK nuclease domain-containing protein [Chloroflexota bacterium]